MKKQLLILFYLFLSCFGIAQTAQIDSSGVKIYSHQSSIYENKFWVSLYKIDWNANTIQYAQINLNEGEKISDVKSITKLFRNAAPASKFIVINPNEIKVERIRRSRSWLNFATPRVKSSPAEKYFIKGDSLGLRKNGGGYLFNKDLTFRYQQELQEAEH